MIKRQTLGWLNDPKVFRVDEMPAHSDHKVFASEEEYRKGESSLSLSLDGTWNFCYAPNPLRRPGAYYRPDFDASFFESIDVPSHIEMSGYSQIQYVNNLFPWDGRYFRRPPETGLENPDFSEAPDNEVGCYRRTFTVPSFVAEKKMRVSVCFYGAERALFVYCNGTFVGFAEDSFTPSEFDLTPYLVEGENLLCATVYKHSKATFLEDQDFFRFFGLFRSVKLHFRPDTHIEDIALSPVLSENLATGTLSAVVSLTSREQQAQDLTLSARLLKNGQLIEEVLTPAKEDKVSFSFSPVADPALWSPAFPALYEVKLALILAGEVLEVASTTTGFRRLSVDPETKMVSLNGKRLKILGVNRHEWSARKGRVIAEEEMKQDIAIMKEAHINAVRTSHYPNSLPFYGLCDEAGIIVMAETNLESHGTWQKFGGNDPTWNVPGSFPDWKEIVVDRCRTQYEWLKNHPSILFWSLGNESYGGENIAAMDAFYKEKQDGRLTHYEGVAWNREYRDRVSDLESRMYAYPDEIERFVKESPDKPFVLCEYMHDMGNSLGGMPEYMKLFSYPAFLGGFIWDFIDQALYVTDEVTGKDVLRYGGDFDDRPSNYEFSGNGIVFADRTKKPAFDMVSYMYGKEED